MDALRDALFGLVEADQPVTVRQTFYRAVCSGLVPKTENACDKDVGRLLVQMRRQGRLPWSWIADNTRWQRKPDTYSSKEQALRLTAQCYRRAIWDNQPVYVEVWCEKDALAGVLVDVTEEWDVPLMVSKGFASATYLFEAAQAIKAQGKPAHLYYFGDHDPSGVHIDRNIERHLRELAPEAEIHFERVAVLPWQITEWGLPTRPTKKSDSRAKGFEGDSVEVDAIPPQQLRDLVRECIERHVDRHQLEVLQVAEENERAWFTTLCEQMWGAR
jgi:hypothetical protein